MARVFYHSSDLPRLHFEWAGRDGTTNHVWLCNFRRYGWAWTTDPKGEEGYAHGVTYANNELPIHYMAVTPDLVIRDSLIATWEQMRAIPGFRQLFDSHRVHELLTRLFEDAVQNVSSYATPSTKRREYREDELEISEVQE